MFTAACEAPIVRVKGEQTYEFPRLKRGQLGGLLARWGVQDRELLKVRLAEAGATPEQKLKELAELDEASRLLGYAYRSIFQFERAAETVEASLKLLLPGNGTVDALPFGPEELFEVAAELWGMPRPKPEKDVGRDNPPSDGAASPTPTGG